MRYYSHYLDAYARGVAARLGREADLAVPQAPAGRVTLAARAAVALGLRDAQGDAPPKPWEQIKRGIAQMLEGPPRLPRCPHGSTPSECLRCTPPAYPARRGPAETLMGDLPAPDHE